MCGGASPSTASSTLDAKLNAGSAAHLCKSNTQLSYKSVGWTSTSCNKTRKMALNKDLPRCRRVPLRQDIPPLTDGQSKLSFVFLISE